MAKIKLVVSATIEETFSNFIISKKTKGLAEKTLQSYQSQFQAVARHMDVKMDIAMLQKADLDAMIISMRDAFLSPNSINSYTRTLKSFLPTMAYLFKPTGLLQRAQVIGEPSALVLLKNPIIYYSLFAKFSTAIRILRGMSFICTYMETEDGLRPISFATAAYDP